MTDRTTPDRVLVTGATGDVGGALVRELAVLGVPARVLVRRSEQAAAFRARGVEAAVGTLDDPVAVRTAMTGCSQVGLVLPATPDQLRHDRAAVDAAVAAGVRHVVKVSASDAACHSPVPWARAHALGDEHLRRSGLAWTGLGAAAFMQNLLTEAPAIRRGMLPQTSGHGATAWIDAADVGTVAARVLADPGAQGGPGDDGRRLLLTGTPATSYVQVAGILSAVLGRRVRYVQLPAPVMYAALRASGQSHWAARGLVAQFLVVRRGDDGVRLTSPAAADLLRREPTSLEAFAAAHRDELR